MKRWSRTRRVGRRAVRHARSRRMLAGNPQEAREGVGIRGDHPDGLRRHGRPAPRHEARDERLTPDDASRPCRPRPRSPADSISSSSPRPWPRREPRGDRRPAGSRGTARSRGAAAAGSGIGALCGARGRPRRRSARRSGSRAREGQSVAFCLRARPRPRALPGEDLLDELRGPEAEHRVDVIGEPESLDDAAGVFGPSGGRRSALRASERNESNSMYSTTKARSSSSLRFMARRRLLLPLPFSPKTTPGPGASTLP